jgi:hypothetical protein
MGIITSTVRVGQKPPKEVIKRVKKAVREARKHPEAYDPECPPSTPEALKEFAHLAAERNRRKKKAVGNNPRCSGRSGKLQKNGGRLYRYYGRCPEIRPR